MDGFRNSTGKSRQDGQFNASGLSAHGKVNALLEQPSVLPPGAFENTENWQSQ